VNRTLRYFPTILQHGQPGAGQRNPKYAATVNAVTLTQRIAALNRIASSFMVVGYLSLIEMNVMTRVKTHALLTRVKTHVCEPSAEATSGRTKERDVVPSTVTVCNGICDRRSLQPKARRRGF
jgi:hypothetical protein